MRIVDLETKSYSNSPRPTINPRRLESRIEELTNQLQHSNSVKSDNSRLRHSSDKFARDVKMQVAENDRIRQRLEEERKIHESQIIALRQQMDALVCLCLVTGCYFLMMPDTLSKRKKVTRS